MSLPACDLHLSNACVSAKGCLLRKVLDSSCTLNGLSYPLLRSLLEDLGLSGVPGFVDWGLLFLGDSGRGDSSDVTLGVPSIDVPCRSPGLLSALACMGSGG